MSVQIDTLAQPKPSCSNFVGFGDCCQSTTGWVIRN